MLRSREISRWRDEFDVRVYFHLIADFVIACLRLHDETG